MSVYIVMTEGRKIQQVFSDKCSAMIKVRQEALRRYGITPDNTPLDFDGSLMTYGWADKVWWTRELVY